MPYEEPLILDESGEEKQFLPDNRIKKRKAKKAITTKIAPVMQISSVAENEMPRPQPLYSIHTHIGNQFSKTKINYDKYRSWVGFPKENTNNQVIFTNKLLKKMPKTVRKRKETGKLVLIECFSVQCVPRAGWDTGNRAIFGLCLNNSDKWTKHEQFWDLVESSNNTLISSLEKYFFSPDLENCLLSYLLHRSKTPYFYLSYPPDEEERIHVDECLETLLSRWRTANIKSILSRMHFSRAEKAQILGNVELMNEYITTEYYLNFLF